ncbi:hypothetical protein TEA_007255 [Camellia sinensis var. sinensis]|uniref:Uncharacterized protein n=1 Tax=Camellia sinensis var. sinensis TaxID=542762 RepID=A0A4S4D480_CAMSN|nr:hypothetical protein TEA_007255 [Camellia sinensis var. sinensis]
MVLMKPIKGQKKNLSFTGIQTVKWPTLAAVLMEPVKGQKESLLFIGIQTVKWSPLASPLFATGVSLLRLVIVFFLFALLYIALDLVGRHPELGTSKLVDDKHALKTMARKASAFPSSIRLNRWQRLIYSFSSIELTFDLRALPTSKFWSGKWPGYLYLSPLDHLSADGLDHVRVLPGSVDLLLEEDPTYDWSRAIVPKLLLIGLLVL